MKLTPPALQNLTRRETFFKVHGNLYPEPRVKAELTRIEAIRWLRTKGSLRGFVSSFFTKLNAKREGTRDIPKKNTAENRATNPIRGWISKVFRRT